MDLHLCFFNLLTNVEIFLPVLVSALKAAASSFELSSSEQLHSLALKSGLLRSNRFVQFPAVDLESEWPAKKRIEPIPNVVVTAVSVLELYTVRVQEDDTTSQLSSDPRNGGVMDGLYIARLELVCHYRLHGNIESRMVL